MADNIVLNAGAGGATVAADDITSVWYQIIKLAYGALDSATIVSTSNGLPIQIIGAIPAGANNIGDVDVLTIAAGDNNIGNVDIVTLPALVAGSATIGAVTGPTADNAANPTLKLGVLPAVALGAAPLRTEGNVNPLRVTLAGDVAVTLDSEAVVLGAGTAEIGKLAAGVANIGDVDVLTIAAGDNNIGNVDIITMPTGASAAQVQGTAAHDAAAAQNPVLLGAYAETPDDTAPGNEVSAEADAVRIAADRDGAIYTHPHPPRIWHVSTEYTTQQTDITVKAAPGVGLSLYITDIYLAVNAAVNVTIKESTTTLKWKYYASGQGDGASVNFTVPIKITANTLISITTSGAVTLTLVVTGYTAP